MPTPPDFLMRIPALPGSAFDVASTATSTRGLLEAIPELAAAVAVASPSLRDACSGRLGQASERAALPALRRYAIRMATRPTPFGLFAGVAPGRFGRAACVEFGNGWRVRARPDMGLLYRLIYRLEMDGAVFPALRVQANPAMLLVDGRATVPDCAEMMLLARTSTGTTSVRATRVVRLALALAGSLRPVRDVVDGLQEATGLAAERGLALLAELRDSSLLLTELRPPLTTSDPLGHVVRVLRSAGIETGELEGVSRSLEALSSPRAWPRPQAIDDANSRVIALAAGVARVPGPAGTPREGPLAVGLHVDLALGVTDAELPVAVGAATEDAARALIHLATGGPYDALRARLVRDLHRAYGEMERVPIGDLWAAGLLDPGHSDDEHGPGVKRLLRNDRLLRLAFEAAVDRRPSVELDDGLLRHIAGDPPGDDELPATVEVFASVLAASAAAIERGEFRLVIAPGTGAQAAGRSMARFDGLVEQPGMQDGDTDARVMAELVTMPRDPRIANVVVRETSSRHEIALGVPSPGAVAIPLRDLEMGSAPDGGLGLWWSTTGQRVFVTHRSMLNPLWAPQLARILLCAGSPAGRALVPFSWGPAEGTPYLPRVTRGRTVLRPAQWQVEAGPGEDVLQALDRARHRFAVPRYVSIGEGDQSLTLDLTGQAGIEELRRVARSGAAGTGVVLREAVPAPTDAWVPGPRGLHIVELAVQLRLRDEVAPARPNGHHGPVRRHGPRPHDETRRPGRGPGAAQANRLRPPGSEWSYVRLPGPDAEQVALLLGPVADLVADPEVARLADRWFFVRYRDPLPHVRLRLRAGDPAAGPELLARVARWIALNGFGRASVEPYARELTRYGGPEALEETEAVFAADSAATLELLRLVHRAGQDPLVMGVVSLRGLCRAAGLDDAALIDWLSRELDTQAGPEFRKLKAILWTALATPSNPGIATGDRNERVALACSRLAAVLDAPTMDRVIRGWVHMHANRLFGPDVARERLAHGLLRRTLRSINAQISA